jgi:hypothetical protein
MTDNMRIGPEGRDDTVTRALREVYAAPDDPVFWDALEARILTRVAAEGDGWWLPFQEWMRTGLVAAGILVAAAALTLAQLRTDSRREAMQSVIETPRTLAHQMATETTPLPDREATLRLVTAP